MRPGKSRDPVNWGTVNRGFTVEIVGEEFVTFIGLSNEFYMNLLFDRSIYRPMYTHTGYHARHFCEEFRLQKQCPMF